MAYYLSYAFAKENITLQEIAKLFFSNNLDNPIDKIYIQYVGKNQYPYVGSAKSINFENKDELIQFIKNTPEIVGFSIMDKISPIEVKPYMSHESKIYEIPTSAIYFQIWDFAYTNYCARKGRPRSTEEIKQLTKEMKQLRLESLACFHRKLIENCDFLLTITYVFTNKVWGLDGENHVLYLKNEIDKTGLTPSLIEFLEFNAPDYWVLGIQKNIMSLGLIPTYFDEQISTDQFSIFYKKN